MRVNQSINRGRWFRLCHPGGPGCRNNKDFYRTGYDFEKNAQCHIQMTIQVGGLGRRRPER